MLVDDLVVEVRDRDFKRVGQLSDHDKTGLKVIPRANAVGSWSVTLRDSVLGSDGVRRPHALCHQLRQPGFGLIVTGPDGVILSGPTEAAQKSESTTDPDGSWEITGISDSHVLDDPLAWGDPMHALDAQERANDTRKGARESLLIQYVHVNVGGAALPERQNPRLDMSPDDGRGATITKSPRFQRLLELCQEIAGDELLFDVVQEGDRLRFRVMVPRDLTKTVRMDVANDQLAKTSYGYAAPGLTDVLVAGQGEGVERTIIHMTSDDSEQAKADWGRRIEEWRDQRQTDEMDELTQAGDEMLLKDGATVKSVQAVPSDDLSMAYGHAWTVGDRVTAVIGGSEVAAVAVEGIIMVTAEGVRVGATLGDTSGFDWESRVQTRIVSAEDRISRLERAEAATKVDAADVVSGTLDRDRLPFQIASGTVTITPSAPDTPTSVTVTLPINRFMSAPVVAVTVHSGVPETAFAGVLYRTTTSFEMFGTRHGTTAFVVGWIAYAE